MSEVLSDSQMAKNDRAAKDEKRILQEIEDSFCVAGYELLETTVEHLGRKLERQA